VGCVCPWVTLLALYQRTCYVVTLDPLKPCAYAH